ncbi:hypothetical protein HYC85_005997 [Camellia sinensis]|uniref:AP2/ERF domain-containing protein n=1 Tax=Camellia sinensis TaxID=4442 RepID=A0A7J7I135_CAMSI|nr:hypothetical protein HYC85_005997 [Camellia sinensis]
MSKTLQRISIMLPWHSKVDWHNRGFMPKINMHQEPYRHGSGGYNETETMQLLNQTHIQLPSSLQKANDMHKYGQFAKGSGPPMQHHMFPPQLSSSNYQIQYPSSSNGGGRTAGDLSLSSGDQQWQLSPPQLFATAAASSGFPQQFSRPQNWLHKIGFHSLMRPS